MNDRRVRPFVEEDDLPLRGVRVVDLSRFLAAPYAATLLGDMGADVIKVEALDRDDPAAHTAPLVGSDSMYYLSTIRNKRSLRINLKSEDGYAILERLCADADVVIENYRRDVPARLGLEYADFQRMNERVVVCSLRSYSAESRHADSPAYDSAVQAYTGLMSVTGPEGGPVSRMGIAVADLGAGLFAAVGILGALHTARSTGKGRHVEVALADAGLGLMSLQLASFMNAGTLMRPQGTSHPAMAPLRVFSTRTGDILVMAAKNEEFVRLCEAVGVPYLLDDERFASNASRVEHQEALHAELEKALCNRTCDEVEALCANARIAATPVRSPATISSDDDFRRTMMSTHEHHRLGKINLVRNPIQFGGASLPFRSLAPGWGENTQELLDELGFESGAIEDMVSRGIVE